MCHPDYCYMETTLFSREENFSFWKNILFTILFFTMAPITLFTALFSLYSLNNSSQSKTVTSNENLIVSPQSGVKVFASLPVESPSIGSSIGASDARPEIIRQYLKTYNSPLLPYANFIVATADKYSIDFRLITAIAQQESNVCKIIPPGSYNCWGWGITGTSSLGFDSYEHGIDTVSKGLRENYLDKGYKTVEDIMSKYTPLSNGSWARGVSQFMSEMQ